MHIHVPEPTHRSAGCWARDMTTGELRFIDTMPEHGGTVTTRWPRMDRYHAYIVERAVDSVLNAAGGSRSAVQRVFRTVRGIGTERHESRPSAFWDRVWGRWAVSGGDFSLYAGDDHGSTFDSPSRAGLVIDDSTASLDVTGFRGGLGSSSFARPWTSTQTSRIGEGPGGALFNQANQPGAGGGHSTAGTSTSQTTREHSGQPVPAILAIRALFDGTYDRDTLAMGGGGAAHDFQGTGNRDGGAGGAGIVRRAQFDITESTNRTLTGVVGTGSGNERVGGPGSGGGYYAICRDFTLSAGTAITLTGGDNGNTDGGNGRLTVFSVNAPTISGAVTNGEPTWIQLYPAIPFGGALVSG